MNKTKRYKIFSRLKEQRPEPKSDLIWSTPFELLIAVLLSAQATDISVNKATAKLFAVANTAQAILDLGEERLKNYIKTIGLFNSKAKNTIKTCEILVDQFNGEIPKTREQLEALPGVGRKTANVVLNIAFNKPTIAVDTHVFRVANRTKFATGKTVDEIELKLLRFTPKEFLHHAHHWFILHGRYVCMARKPKCAHCCISDLCEFKEKIL